MSLFVKICGLKSSEAVAAAVAAGADALGFVFADSPRQITPAAAAQLVANVPRSILRVAVTKHPSRAACDAIFAEFEPDYLQTDVADLKTIVLPRTCSALPVYREGQAAEIHSGQRLLFEGKHSGSGKTADWSEARNLAKRCELILAGGLNADNVADAIRQVRPWGVDVSSGVELRRGHKDPRKIVEFIARVRAQELERDQYGS